MIPAHFNSCFLERWRRCLLPHWYLTSAWVIPDLLDITTHCTGSSSHSSTDSNTVGCFMGPRHTREKSLTQSPSFLMHPLCSWAVCAFVLPCAGSDLKCLVSSCPGALGGRVATHYVRLHTGEPVPKPHTRL